MEESTPRAIAIVSCALAAIFLVLCLLHLHGFSLAAWHRDIDHTPEDEVLLGSARQMRSDDWMAMLPLVFAQDVQRPSFPQTSELVGYGGFSTLVAYPAPVRSWVTLFRPQIWGYLVGRDFGMSWQWWLRMLGLFYAAFLTFELLTSGRTTLALGLSTALVFAPLFQFFSFNCEPLCAMALLSFRSLAGIMVCRRPRALALWGLLLTWSATSFALSVIYPPFQICLAWLLVFVASGWLYAERRRIAERSWLLARASVAGTALILALCALVAFLAQNREAIQIVRATLYPGRRFSSGGDLPLVHFFSGSFVPFFGETWGKAFLNISESGSFFFFFPMLSLLTLWEWWRVRARPHPMFPFLAAFWVLAFLYGVLGVPDTVAQLLLNRRVTGVRMMLGMGLADFMMLALFLASPNVDAGAAGSRRGRLVLACAWIATLGMAGVAVAARAEDALFKGLAVAGLLALAIVPVALRARASVAALALLSIAATAWFNPLVRGGSEYLAKNPFSRAVLELDRAAGGGTRWLVYQDRALANVFRTLGMRAINGLHYYPQRELWERLGVSGDTYERLCNRYAHVTFDLSLSKKAPSVALDAGDRLIVRLNPDDPAFARLGLDFVVFVGPDRSVLDGVRRLSWVASVGDKHIFRVSS